MADTTPTVSSTAPSSDISVPPQKIRHEWYQTDNEVVLSVFIKNVKPEELKVDLLERSISLQLQLATGSTLSFDLDPLSHAIVPATSSYRVTPVKVELKLIKSERGIKWSALEGNEDTVPMATATTSAPTHAYPTSSKTRTNWDALAKKALAEEEEGASAASKDPNAGGDKALNELFQKLYADATDEQRRAMVKSYQESNGTALSTDWSSVAKGTVETKPPDSMVAKKWGE